MGASLQTLFIHSDKGGGILLIYSVILLHSTNPLKMFTLIKLYFEVMANHQ